MSSQNGPARCQSVKLLWPLPLGSLNCRTVTRLKFPASRWWVSFNLNPFRTAVPIWRQTT